MQAPLVTCNFENCNFTCMRLTDLDQFRQAASGGSGFTFQLETILPHKKNVEINLSLVTEHGF